MTNNQGEAPERAMNPPASRMLLDIGGSLSLGEAKSNSATGAGTLLDSALFNLNIAQQYIDESKHLVEHRLICFHYAVALLARYRQPYNQAMIGLARQYLVDASNWRFLKDENARRLEDAHDRIVCEAHYNLGVIDELEGDLTSYSIDALQSSRSAAIYSSAEGYYARATAVAKERRNYSGVEILARFGHISVGVKGLKLIPLPAPEAEVLKRQNIRAEILLLKSKINEEGKSEEGKAPAAKAFDVPTQREEHLPKPTWWQRFVIARPSGKEEKKEPPAASLDKEQLLRRNTTLTLLLKRLSDLEGDLQFDQSEKSEANSWNDDPPPLLP